MDINGILTLLDYADRIVTQTLNYNGGTAQDFFWNMMSSRAIWAVPAVALIAYMLCRKDLRSKTVLVVVSLAVVVALSDQTTSSFMKPFFARLRPSHTPGFMQTLHYVGNYRGALYGFASSHASNSFGAVTFVCLWLRNRRLTVALVTLATCVCYSRIYLGVHFFGDVLVGALIGTAYGWTVYKVVAIDWSTICSRMTMRMRNLISSYAQQKSPSSQ